MKNLRYTLLLRILLLNEETRDVLMLQAIHLLLRFNDEVLQRVDDALYFVPWKTIPHSLDATSIEKKT